MNRYKNQILIQLRYAIDSWKRLTEYIVQESYCLKNHLAEVTEERGSEKDFLVVIEDYLARIMQLETTLSFVKLDVLTFEKVIGNKTVKNLDLNQIIQTKCSIDKELNKVNSQLKNIGSTFDNFMIPDKPDNSTAAVDKKNTL